MTRFQPLQGLILGTPLYGVRGIRPDEFIAQPEPGHAIINHKTGIIYVREEEVDELMCRLQRPTVAANDS